MSHHIFKNPKKYSKNNALQYNFAMDILSKIIFSAKSRVLDIGCGDGVITNEIAKIVHEGCVIGTDISTQMVEYASKEYSSQPNLRFLQMDASKNIFHQQFDIITSFNCLHWVKDQENTLIGIAKAAAEGAQISLLLSHRKSLYHEILDSICSKKKWSSYFTNVANPRLFFDLDQYKDMVINAGLNVVSIIEEEMTYFYRTKNQLKDFFSSSGAQVKQIPDMLKKDFIIDFSDEFVREINSEDGSMIPVSFWCLQVIASKLKL